MSRIDCSYCTSHLAGLFDIVQFQKISILPPQKGLEFPGGLGVLFWPYSPRGGIGNKSVSQGGSVRPKNSKKCMESNWDFQREKSPFRGGSMDIFWNCTFSYLTELHVLVTTYQ